MRQVEQEQKQIVRDVLLISHVGGTQGHFSQARCLDPGRKDFR
ncbi:hypothetical protein NY78_3009 [Desulfovibrio sp. TomC]|nr:hypothetical protein NY78_3009 [Desulfovibrio sp. TomC]